jgi:hypothetical protein
MCLVRAKPKGIDKNWEYGKSVSNGGKLERNYGECRCAWRSEDKESRKV